MKFIKMKNEKSKKSLVDALLRKTKNLAEKRGSPCKARELIVKACYKLGQQICHIGLRSKTLSAYGRVMFYPYFMSNKR